MTQPNPASNQATSSPMQGAPEGSPDPNTLNRLQAMARECLTSGQAQVVIGYEIGTAGRRRPCFVQHPSDVERLVLDDGCTQNLGTYLTKAEVRSLGRIAVVALPPTLQAVARLTAEKQLEAGQYCLIVPRGETWECIQNLDGAAALAAPQLSTLREADQALLTRLQAMSQEARQQFWQEAFARCVRCYACRSSCPLCYCGRCTMDCNRPQWVPVPSHALGNLQYHMVRAMHLAGRCVGCGDCGRACPVGIPVHLLSLAGQQSVSRHFGPNTDPSSPYVLGTFRPDDRETFIR